MTTDSISNSDSYTEPTESPENITTGEAYDRLKDTLFSALESEENTVIDAPTSLGKSHLLATTAWREYPEITGNGLVIHIHQTTDARDEAVQRSEDADGVSHHLFEGREDACPVARGDYDDQVNALQGFRPSEWLDHMCDVRGFGFGSAHEKLDKSRNLPCTSDGQCPSFKQWWKDLRDDGEPQVDVVHMTANFAYESELIDGANLVFDERPEYSLSLDNGRREQIRDSISNLLQHRSDGKYSVGDILPTNESFTPELKSRIAELLDEEISQDWHFEYAETHRYAREIGLAILNAEEVFSHQWHGENGDKKFSCRWKGEYGGIEVVLSGKGKIHHIHHRPDLSEARCIIGLDAFPSEYRWQLNTVDEIQRVNILSSKERRFWRQNERGLKIVQLGKNTRSYTQGWEGAGEARAEGLINALRQKFGSDFRSCISSDKIVDDIVQQMRSAGIRDPLKMNYGGQNSRNDFEDERIGLLAGCIDPGDGNILDLLALRRKEAEPEMIHTEDGGITRAPGRTFLGPDRDTAHEMLVSVRESNIAQGVGRYARNPRSEGSDACVFVWSDACPDSLTDEVVDLSFSSLTDDRRDMLRALRDGCETRLEIEKRTGNTKSYINRSLKRFHNEGLVDKAEGEGKYGATVWKLQREYSNLPEVIVNFESEIVGYPT